MTALRPFADYFATLQVIRASAACLISDDTGRIVAVQPTYKDHWELPGGAVDPGESPMAAARREAREETGREVTLGRLRCLEYRDRTARSADSMLHFVFEATFAAPGDQPFSWPEAELRSVRYLELDEAQRLLGPVVGARMRVAARAVTDDTFSYVETVSGSATVPG